jgi:hypothetical protein
MFTALCVFQLIKTEAACAEGMSWGLYNCVRVTVKLVSFVYTTLKYIMGKKKLAPLHKGRTLLKMLISDPSHLSGILGCHSLNSSRTGILKPERNFSWISSGRLQEVLKWHASIPSQEEFNQ